ncbi:MAG TPA: hypothetical protein VFP53_01245 [Sphingomicrobium sp.]|nr:hypothetical protein [Sphingomicrobium sp.]
MTEDMDARIAEFLAEPPAAPDEAFVERVNRSVLAERKIVAAQAALWRRFAVESLGSLGIVAAFYLLWRMSPDDLSIDQLTVAPVLAASMVLFLWFGVQLKPAAAGK